MENKEFSITFAPPDSFPWEAVDPAIIQPVVDNLSTNAIKHSYSGGEIEIEIYQQSANVIMAVKDQGMGCWRGRLTNYSLFFGVTDRSTDWLIKVRLGSDLR
jgi:signal transduction histidine kinase